MNVISKMHASSRTTRIRAASPNMKVRMKVMEAGHKE